MAKLDGEAERDERFINAVADALRCEAPDDWLTLEGAERAHYDNVLVPFRNAVSACGGLVEFSVVRTTGRCTLFVRLAAAQK